MLWEEETPRDAFQVPQQVLDLAFSLKCRELPVDHAHALRQALRRVLPWLAEDERIGIHAVHVAGSQNGWERPDPASGQRLMLSQRTRLTLRAPRDRLEDLRRGLTGVTLDVAGCPMTLGEARIRPLSKEATLFARHLVMGSHPTEAAFLDWVVEQLADLGIRARKALCGKCVTLVTPEGPLPTRALMLADLSPEESVRLQERGLGPDRQLGCGLFIPHKGVGVVKH